MQAFMKKNELRSNCPINFALENIGDKWALLIIRDIVFEGKQFYREFLKSEERIATNILSARLKKLEQLGIVESKVYEEQRTKKMYSLMQKGKELIPMLVEMIVWSAKNGNDLNVSQEFLQKFEQNRAQVIKAITESIGTKKFSANPDA